MSPALLTLATGIGLGVFGAGTFGAWAAWTRARSTFPAFLCVSGIGSLIAAYAIGAGN